LKTKVEQESQDSIEQVPDESNPKKFSESENLPDLNDRPIIEDYRGEGSAKTNGSEHISGSETGRNKMHKGADEIEDNDKESSSNSNDNNSSTTDSTGDRTDNNTNSTKSLSDELRHDGIRVILGPSGIGKTSFSVTNKDWIDGDQIIAKAGIWPKIKNWWKDEKLDKVVRGLAEQELMTYLKENPDAKITTPYPLPEFDKETVYVNLPVEEHKLKVSGKTRDTGQPTVEDFDKRLSPARAQLLKYAKDHDLKTISEFKTERIKDWKQAGNEIFKRIQLPTVEEHPVIKKYVKEHYNSIVKNIGTNDGSKGSVPKSNTKTAKAKEVNPHTPKRREAYNYMNKQMSILRKKHPSQMAVSN
jgi:hypothetical protein